MLSTYDCAGGTQFSQTSGASVSTRSLGLTGSVLAHFPWFTLPPTAIWLCLIVSKASLAQATNAWHILNQMNTRYIGLKSHPIPV